jgi:hypothetical protein
VAQVLTLAQLAHRIQAPGTLRAQCCTFLARLTAEEVSWQDVVAYYSLSEEVRHAIDACSLSHATSDDASKPVNAPGISAPCAGADGLGDHSVIGTTFSGKLRSRYIQYFLDLPAAAAQVLVSCDELAVLSENVVATAVGAWAAVSEEGRWCEAVRELLPHLRLHHLMQAYTAEVLLQLPAT